MVKQALRCRQMIETVASSALIAPEMTQDYTRGISDEQRITVAK